MPELTVDGARLHYETRGRGGGAILFVHGHPFNRSMWAPQAEIFASEGWRTVLFDLRGYGDSARGPETSFAFERFSRDIETLMDHLRLREAVLCGLSMGGQIVMDCCRRFPHRVCGVVLAATSPQAETAESRADRLAMADRLEAEGLGPYAEEVLPKMLSQESIAAMPDLAAYVLDMMRRSDPGGAAAAQRARADRVSYEPAIAALACPALIAVGDSDAFTTRGDADLMNAAIAGSELLWLPQVGHMPNLEGADAFNRAMGRLLDRVAARQAEAACA